MPRKMARQDYWNSILVYLLLLSTLGVVYAANSASNNDEPLLSMFESFLPNAFLEKSVGLDKDVPQPAKSKSAATKKNEDALKTAHAMLEGFKNIVDGLNSPDNGDCMFKCPNGVQPKPNPSFKPVPNGCGSHGLKIDVSDLPGIGTCCNAHDVCYGTCNSGQAVCDSRFNACMADACVAMRGTGVIKTDRKMDECKAMGATFHLTVMAVGCEFYRGSQKKACLCRPESKAADNKASDAAQEKIRKYNEAKRAREAEADADPVLAMDEADIDLSSPTFDLPEAIEHGEL